MSARSKARKRALDVLYAADVREMSLEAAISQARIHAAEQPERAGSWPYALELLEGVELHNDEIDALIQNHTRDWTLDRMPSVDRALLRLASWEILYNPEIPAAVAISEAASSARTLSTEDSARFINGVLSAIAVTASQTAGELADEESSTISDS